MEIADKNLLSLLNKYYLIAKIQYETTLSLFEITNGEVFKAKLENLRQRDWQVFADPEFFVLLNEACCRGLHWEPTPIAPEKEFAMNRRGDLIRHIIGATRDCIGSHGPITRDLAPSLAKRVHGAMMAWFHDQAIKGNPCAEQQPNSVGKNVPKLPSVFPSASQNKK
jgi:hypothetical protein